MQGNYANTTHPEWMIRSPENWNNDTQTPGRNMYGLDLSDPECVDWLVDWVGDTMVEFNCKMMMLSRFACCPSR
eukprot:COSAG04_NODE_1284_length_7376_cov_4.157345_11_plen_74_part_00